MKSQSILPVSGKKISRKTSDATASIIVADSGEQYTLLAGKERKDMPATLLGSGDFGRVKLATDKNNQTVAVKIFKLERGAIEENIKNELKFSGAEEKEATLPKLVVTHNKAYLFRPYVEGAALVIHEIYLNRWIRKGYIPELAAKINSANSAERKTFITQYCNLALKLIDAIALLQQKDIYHDDMHMGNVIYNPSTQVITIIDFNSRSLRISEITMEDVKAKWSYDNATVDFILAKDFDKGLSSFIEEKDFDESINEVRDFVSELYAISNSFMSKITDGVSLVDVIARTKEQFNAIILKASAEVTCQTSSPR